MHVWGIFSDQPRKVEKLRLFKRDALEITFRMMFGTLVSALGLAVLIGWYTNNIVLIQLAPDLTPMQANTALGMLLSGLSILFLKNHRKIVILFSILIFLMSALTLLQYIFGINIGIDQLLLKATITTNTSHPGRMAPNTALCFVLTSLMFFTIAFSNRFTLSDVVAVVLCTVIGILGLTSLTGYFFGVTLLYAWGNMTAMAMHTASGFLGISFGCFLFILNQILKNKTWKQYCLIIIICAINIPLFLISWQALVMYQNNLIKTAVQGESIYGYDMLELLLSNRLNVVTRLFLRGKYHEHYKTDSWKRDANTYLSAYPALQSISVEAASTKMVLHIRNPNEATTAKNNIKICHALLQQENNNASLIKNSMTIASNEQLFCIADYPEKFIAVFNTNQLFDIIFSMRTWKNYDVELKNKSTVLFLRNKYGASDAFRKQWGISKHISLLGQQWNLEIWPDEAFVKTRTSLFLQFFLLFGLLLTILLIIVVRLWQLSVSKNKSIELIYKTTTIASNANNTKTAMTTCLNLICTTIDWPVGHIYILNKDKVPIMESAHIWYLKNPEQMNEFKMISESMQFSKGMGLPGRIWNTKKPAWITDVVKDNNFSRATYCRNVNIHGAVGFPILLNNEVIAVFEFFSYSLQEYDEQVLHAFEVMSKQISHIFERNRSHRELKKRAQQLKESNTMLESFAYAASHDLKAPLRVIDNVSKWLEEDLEPHLTPETRENMQLLRGRVKRMEKLLDDLLEYSRIGRVQDARFSERIAGDVLMKDILELLNPPTTFLISVDSYFSKIILPRMPLQQIFMNLISNAIKHHDKTNGQIDICVKEDEQYYTFSVKDDGPGIPVEFQEKIFNLFQTLKPRDQVEGSGMGLAMVKKNISTYGGTLHLESVVGNGSTFSFTWPIKK